jgi:hypothetical protein
MPVAPYGPRDNVRDSVQLEMPQVGLIGAGESEFKFQVPWRKVP